MVPFRNILIPLDGSELAEKALKSAAQLASALAKQTDAGEAPVKLTLLRVATPLTFMAADPALFDEMIRMSIDEAQAYLQATAPSVMTAADPAIVETKVVSGFAADVIVHFAEENGIDLIIMSSHGRTGSKRWIYGSVAEKVMHHASCATAIVRAHVSVDMFQNRKILVPLDGSELAERALDPAMAIAAAVKSDVLLLRVVADREPLPATLDPIGDDVAAALDKTDSLERAEAEAYLQRVHESRHNQHLFFDVQSVDGDIADAIISYADSRNVDLVIISSHGRSGIGRWLHGSVAEKVLRGADCATLIIRQGRN